MDVLVRCARTLGVTLLVISSVPVLPAENVTEDKVKAAFIYNFTHFVRWPPASFVNASDPVTICTESSDSLQNAIAQTVRDKSLEGRPFVVRSVGKENDINGCHVAYFSKPTKIRGGPGVLTIVDDNASSQSEPGAITLVLQSNRIRFVINAQAANRAGITISSKLLNLALRVDQ